MAKVCGVYGRNSLVRRRSRWAGRDPSLRFGMAEYFVCDFNVRTRCRVTIVAAWWVILFPAFLELSQLLRLATNPWLQPGSGMAGLSPGLSVEPANWP